MGWLYVLLDWRCCAYLHVCGQKIGPQPSKLWVMCSAGKRVWMAWRTPVAGWCAFRHEMAGGKAWRIPLNLHGRIFIALSLLGCAVTDFLVCPGISFLVDSGIGPHKATSASPLGRARRRCLELPAIVYAGCVAVYMNLLIGGIREVANIGCRE